MVHHKNIGLTKFNLLRCDVKPDLDSSRLEPMRFGGSVMRKHKKITEDKAHKINKTSFLFQKYEFP